MIPVFCDVNLLFSLWLLSYVAIYRFPMSTHLTLATGLNAGTPFTRLSTSQLSMTNVRKHVVDPYTCRQIIVNIRTKSVEGLALPFLANWLFG